MSKIPVAQAKKIWRGRVSAQAKGARVDTSLKLPYRINN